MPADIPVISSITPTSGPLAGGTAVTISGREFVYVTGVWFGTTAATSYTVTSASRINATSPAGSAGTVNITVGNTKGTSATSAADQFTYSSVSCDVPVIIYLTGSNSGSTGGGTTVVIHGSNLDCGTATVKFGTVTAASATVDSDTQITAVSPAHAAGTVDITVTNTGGTSATSAADQFTYE